jgi:UDP-glucose 4-epimerase
MRTVVTGGAGFIGSHLVDRLIAAGHEVVVVDNLVTGKRSNLNPRVRFYQLDVGRPGFKSVLNSERPEVVFHQAAQMSVKVSTDRPRYDARVNVLALLNVLESCVAAGVRKIVFASSGATYGDSASLPLHEDTPQRPESPYGISKLTGELYLNYYGRDHGLHYTILRYGNVYGPRQDAYGEAGVVAIFARQLLTGHIPVIHWDGEQVRDYVYVDDVAQANLLAATLGDERCYCIGTGAGTSVNQLYQLVCAAVGVAVAPARGPRRAGDLHAAYFDTQRARDELGWAPTLSLRDGVTRTVEWFRSELWMARREAAVLS